MRWPKIILVICFLLSLISVAFSVDFSASSPDDDAPVSEPFADTNYGDNVWLQVDPTSGSRIRSFLEFDTSSLPTSDDVIVSSVMLTMYCFTGVASRTYRLQRINDSWTEGVVTWNDQPTVNSSYVDETAPTSSGAWTVNVTTIFALGSSMGFRVIDVNEGSGTDKATFYSKEHGDNHPAELNVTYFYYPINDALNLTNPSIDSQGCLAQKQAYIFRANVTDNDGGTNIDYVELTLDYNGGAGQSLRFRWTENTDVFSEEYDPSNYVSISSTSDDSSLVSNTWTLDFKITFAWTYPDESLHDIRLYTIDDESYNDDDTYSNKYYVENDLVASSLAVDDYRVNPAQTLTFTGKWKYQGTSITPPDGDYAVKVKLGASQKGSTDTTLVSGAFSINDVTAESTVDSYSYTVEATYMLSAGSFSDVIVDTIIVALSVDDATPEVSQQVTISWTVKTSYDSEAISFVITVTRNNGTLVQDSTSSNASDMSNSPLMADYTASALTDNTYGLTSFTSNTIRVTWQSEEGSSPGGRIEPSEGPVVELPEIKIPKVVIPSWGYWMIAGVVGVVAVGALATAPVKKARRKTRGVKTRKSTYEPRKLSGGKGKRLPRRSKRSGRFQ